MSKYIFVPVGSFEQHGPHLPPDTDYLIAKKIVEVISGKFNGVIADGIKVGVSSEHEGFKNTKSINKDLLKNEIESYINNSQTIDKLIFLNAHGGNNKTLNEVQANCREKILVLNTFSIIKNDLKAIRTSEIGGICHACEFETSLMLFLFPEMVKMKKLRKKHIKYVPVLDPNYEKEKIEDWKTVNYNKYGILGDPFHASPTKGKLWFNILIEKISALVSGFLK